MSSQRLTQTQKMLQKLSPQQILLMKLLQIPTMELSSRIKEEIEENPALEEKENEVVEDEIHNDEDNDFDDNQDYDNDDYDPLSDFDDYMQDDDDDDAAYKLRTNNYSPDDERYEAPISNEESFQDILIQQLGYRNLDEKKYKIGTYIIGNLDDSGYLSRPISGIIDDLLFTQNLDVSEEEVTEVLHIIQDFDPAGVGATNLQECLLIQLRRLQDENDEDDIDYTLPIIIIEQYFSEFTKKHYDKIVKKSGISERQFRAALKEILKLNPKPGGTVGGSQRSNYVIPDFTIYNNCGKLELTLNSRNAPELHVNKDYVDMLNNFAKQKNNKSNKEAINFVKNKIESAKWFIEAVKQRHNTLYVTMEAIMNYQKEYFLTGDETKLKPMILKDISEKVGLDISTISRVANSKYVQTAYGTFSLKSFFSESLTNDDGEEVSTREIKKILMDCIEQEDKSKPLTDDVLTQILKEKGYNIARRTIAKYREQLDIPVARLRKEL
ncbi:MAG: RNA polymerase factor sigma-54 [Lentimicrobiaceae bacterium]|nr:RNA polymerase factor sigma-54 [Lentimicrobiaceae bacterium]